MKGDQCNLKLSGLSSVCQPPSATPSSPHLEAVRKRDTLAGSRAKLPTTGRRTSADTSAAQAAISALRFEHSAPTPTPVSVGTKSTVGVELVRRRTRPQHSPSEHVAAVPQTTQPCSASASREAELG